MSVKRFILVAAILLIVSAQAVNADLEYYGIEDTINEGLTVTNSIVLKFKEPVNHLDYKVNFPIQNLKAYSTFESADCKVKEDNLIACDFRGMSGLNRQLTMIFDTTGGVTEQNGKFVFSASYGFEPTESAFILIRLPQHSVLSEDVANASFSPPDGKIISDGKKIGVYWELEGVNESSKTFSVSYSPGFEIPTYMIISLTIIVIVVMTGLITYALRKRPQSQIMIESVLNKDEKTVVDIMKRREGTALQKHIVKESGFSKAKVSRIVKDMKARGIVDIQPVSGRENKIVLTMGKTEKKVEAKQ